MQIDAVPQIGKDKKRKGKGKGKMKTKGDKGQRGHNIESEGGVICIHFGRNGHYQCECWYTIRSDDLNQKVSSVSQSIEPSTAAQLLDWKGHMERSRASCEFQNSCWNISITIPWRCSIAQYSSKFDICETTETSNSDRTGTSFPVRRCTWKSNSVTESHRSPSKLDLIVLLVDIAVERASLCGCVPHVCG